MAHPGKLALRDQLTTQRNRRSLAELGEASRALAEVALSRPEVRRAATVACYLSVDTEPGTSHLLEALRGKRVIAPLLTPDWDLDWAVVGDPPAYQAAKYGLLEPTAPPLGRDAVATADVVLVPGMAVSAQGFRLGKGGGCYDRTLARVPVGTPVWVVLFDEEVGIDVPVEPHDRSVTAALTPSGVHPLGS